MTEISTATVPAQVEAADAAEAALGAEALMDPRLLVQLGVHPGQPVVVRSADRPLVLTATPSESAGSGVVRLDALSRRTLGSTLGGDVGLSPAELLELGTVRAEVDQRWAADIESVAEKVRRALSGMAVSPGKVVALPLGPDESLVLVRFEGLHDAVGHHVEAGRIGDTTKLRLAAADLHEFLRPATGGLEEVGGNEAAIAELREVVQLAISRPEVFARLGVRPSRGVILHGPPGTGKSLLCRSLAGELDAAFYYISGPEVVGSLHGQTEESLRAVFNDAIDHAPAIICIDEVDALTGNRRSLSSQADMRAVAQLLALMDGLRRAPGVFVIGTTNQVDRIDPAFRRPGRFDREVAVEEPDERGRRAILQVHARAMPLSGKARHFLAEIAAKTIGYTGADLWAVCQRAGLQALRRASEDGGLSRAEHRLAAVESVHVEDFTTALEEVQPASARDGHLVMTEPVDLIGETPAFGRLRELADGVFGQVDGALGAGVLLSGPSGVGKTTLVAKLAHDLDVRLIRVNGGELASRWLGDTEAAMRHLAQLAARLRPSIVLLDNVEAMAPQGASDRSAGEVRLNGQLATVITDLSRTAGVLVIGATAHPEAVDTLVLGATGLRLRVVVAPPTADDRRALIAAFLDERGRDGLPGGLLDELAQASAGLVAADLRTAVALAAGRTGVGDTDGLAGALRRELDDLSSDPVPRGTSTRERQISD